MKVFITGGSGFVGRHIVRKLLQRGYEVRALAHSSQSADQLARLGANVVIGDVGSVESMRGAMSGCDVVMHVAGYAELGEPDPEVMETVNVSGSRKVLRLAHELAVPHIIFSSSVDVFGDTQGETADESYREGGPPLTEHARTKWLAHYQVALPLIAKGAPITIVMPGLVYGPGGRGLIADMMRIFLRGYPVVAGADTVFSYVHVEDVAEGHILASEKGRPGETYILAGPVVPLGDILDLWTTMTGRRGPNIRLPATVVRRAAPLLNAAGRLTGLHAAFSRDSARIAGATFIASSDKARSELGWQTRPLQSGMLETLNWFAASEKDRARLVRRREQQAGAVALVASAVLAAIWYRSRK